MQPRPETREDEPDAESYRPISAAAAAGLVLGLASPLALMNLGLAVLPCASAILSLWTLLRVLPRNPHLLGRKAAIAGLLLSVVSVSAAVADRGIQPSLLKREALATSRQWFTLLSEGQPQKALQLTMPPDERQSLDDDRRLWAYYRDTPKWRRELDHYLGDPVVKTLLALGPNAQVRFLGLASNSVLEDAGFLHLEFAVTFEDAGAKKTFFVMLPMLRAPRKDGKAEWVVYRPTGGIHPENF